MPHFIQPRTPAEEFEKMLKLAVTGHYLQKDKGGNPYIMHILAVVENLKTNDPQLKAIAAGHDLLEDTIFTKDDLHDHGLSKRVIDAIELLTKIKGQSTPDYLRRILGNRDAVLVKIADNEHNTDIHRLAFLDQKALTRLKKYHSIHSILTEAAEWYSKRVDERWPYHRSAMIDYLVNRFIELEK